MKRTQLLESEQLEKHPCYDTIVVWMLLVGECEVECWKNKGEKGRPLYMQALESSEKVPAMS